MTRDEALRRLEGTWAFQEGADGVLVRDARLQERIREILLEREAAPLRAPSAAEPVERRAA